MSGSSFLFFFRTGLLFLFWILLSGKMDFIHLGIGLGCAVVISRISPSVAPEIHGFKAGQMPGILLRTVFYVFWLLGRIALAAFHVSRLILSAKMPIAPEIIRHSTFLKSDIEKVIFANSITLTPGTITVDISGNEFIVHSLDEPSAGDITSQAMEKEIQKILPEGPSA